LVCNLVMA